MEQESKKPLVEFEAEYTIGPRKITVVGSSKMPIVILGKHFKPLVGKWAIVTIKIIKN